MHQRHSTSSTYLLGSLGLALLGLLGWACDQRARPSHPALAWVRKGLCSLVIESVAAIGWAIDHLYPVHAPARVSRISAGNVHVETR